MLVYINTVKALGDQQHSIKVNITDEDVYMVLLMSIHPSFDNLVTSLELKFTKDINLQFIIARLLHEMSKRKECESSKTTAFVNKTHKPNEKLCFYFKKSEHFVRNYLKKKKKMKKKKLIKLVKITSKFVVALIANDHTMYDWIIDSGATQHMTFK